jgi:hypothetical protein
VRAPDSTAFRTCVLECRGLRVHLPISPPSPTLSYHLSHPGVLDAMKANTTRTTCLLIRYFSAVNVSILHMW